VLLLKVLNMTDKMNRVRFVPTMLAMMMTWSCSLSAQTPREIQQDFEVAMTQIAANYAYWDAKATRWNDVPSLYAVQLRAVKSRDEFVALLEQVVDEIYDPHAQLNTNLARSFRLVPSGTDLWAQWLDGKAIITQVRDNSDAARAGIRTGAVVISLDGIPIGNVVDARLGRSYAHSEAAARDWALRSVLAGRHHSRRTLELREGSASRTVELPATDQSFGGNAPLQVAQIRPGIGYVRFNDSLGRDDTVVAFDRALRELRETHGLIIDLRNTASGGNSSVARGILGRFVERELPYQKHASPSEERDTGVHRSWLELVSPRGEFVYSKPVVVLVGRWTGSMGEGLAIGFDATRAGTVVGTPMAGLVGATEQIVLPRTRIRINIPTERLFHVNGTPRDEFVPAVAVDVANTGTDQDSFMELALRVLAQSGAN
jgi:C-terminal processing protease CtpA/Prc